MYLCKKNFMLHYKTKLALQLNLNEVDGCTGAGGSEELGITFNSKNGDILNIPIEANQFLEMASVLIQKADKLIRNQKK